MTIAAYATDCRRGYLYLRGEYPGALEAVSHAIETARRHGYLGEDILGQGFSFEIEVRCGAGAYICGEETAIFNSIEGYRGEPRSKPPFPVVSGLFGKPTVVNNVETLINVLPILELGGPAYAAIGTDLSTGPKLFCVCGHAARPGLYEVPFGETIGALLERAGGVAGGLGLQAVLLGGAAGAFVGPSELEMPLTFEAAREARVTLGSGPVIVFDETVDLPRILMRIAGFFRDESCGQCAPCRVGTVRQEEALARLISGRARGSVEDEVALLFDVGECMRDSSICGLGQTAFSAVDTAIRRLGVFS
jgi:NADH-quinone oxidoreductase subunit F